MKAIKVTAACLLSTLLFFFAPPAADAGITTWLYHPSHTSETWLEHTSQVWGGSTTVNAGDLYTVYASAKKPNGTYYGSATSWNGDAQFNLPHPAYMYPRCRVTGLAGGSTSLICTYIW